MKKLTNVINSFKYIPNAFVYLIGKPKMYPYLAIPLLLNLIITTLLFFLLFNLLSNSVTSLLSFDFLTNIGFFDDLLNVLSFIVSLVISGYLSLSLAIIIQSPFNGMIAEKIFEERDVSDNVDLSGFAMVRYDIKRSIKYELQRFLLTISILIITFILNLLPVVGSILFVLINTLFAYIFNLVDVFDPAYSRFDYSLKTKITQSVQLMDKTAGIGIPLYFFINVPILNFLILPFIFTGSALFIADQNE